VTELLKNNVTAVSYHPSHVTFTLADVSQVKCLGLIGKLTITTGSQPEPPLLEVLHIEMSGERSYSTAEASK